LVDDFLEQSILDLDEELKWSASSSEAGSWSGSDSSEMEFQESDADVDYEDLLNPKGKYSSTGCSV